MALPIILAIIAALFYAATNHIDKFLISKAVKNADFRALALMSTLIAGIIMSVIYLFICNFNLAFDIESIGILLLNSALYPIALIVYFKALDRDDTTLIVIMFQLVPVFLLFFSPLLLQDQDISLIQLIGSIIATIAAIMVTYEPSKKKFDRHKLVTLGMMAVVSFLYAVWFILERYVNATHDFNQTTFWSNFTLIIVGIFIYIFFKSFRKSFNKMIKTNGPVIIGLNLLNELFNSFGGVFSTLAGTMTSVALVSFASQSVQPFAVMIMGIVITKLFPKIAKENISKKETIKRIIAIVICIIGLACIEFG